MYALWILYKEQYQYYRINTDRETVTIGRDLMDSVTLPSLPTEWQTLSIEKLGSSFRIKGDLEEEIKPGKEWTCQAGSEKLSILIAPLAEEDNVYFIGHLEEMFIGSRKGVHIAIPHHEGVSGEWYRGENGRWVLHPDSGSFYLNGERIRKKTEIRTGDMIFTPYVTISLLEDDLISIHGVGEMGIDLPESRRPLSEMKKKYPNYRRTPRMVYDLPEEKVQLSFPSQESDDSGRSLWIIILPPLVMLVVMGFIALVIPRGIFIIISLVMFTTTLITSTVQFFKDKSTRKKAKEKRERVYTSYLKNKRQELQDLAEKQTDVLQFHYPSYERIKYLTEELSDRLWERTLDSPDFLEFRLGTGKVPASYTISLSSSDMANREMDDLLEQSQKMKEVYSEIDHLPVKAELSLGAIGLIGKEAVYKNEIHQMVGQLAFFHSYHDLRFVFIFDEEEYGEWEWMKYLPHFQLPQSYAKGFIYNEKTRDQILSSIYEVLRERDIDDDAKEKVIYSPHYVFIVTNHQLISDHVILQYLEGEYAHLGMSVIFAAEAKESLSENIHTLVRYINDQQGDILIQKKKAVKIPFKLDAYDREGNERYARMLRTLNHQIGMTNSIPTSVSFLGMLGTNDVQQLPIKENWLTRESAKSLAVPVGLKGKEDLVELNLHEKAHGPHGLLAGTTGSGKSEFLQTYILSLAVHFHPHEVAFLLIDYKGGGMAQPFKDIPHLLGTITNIEGSKNFSNRALASIKSELKRRQRLFDRYEVNHINDYTRLYKQGKTEVPLPHLFLISDEFAELKSEEPDFIKELVSAARIGRSLGVHLILATQKPGGVIDNQIWSNARFRVALKVQNSEDSREILKNSDAAAITVTGRGYLQVGNNEVYDLFQSAWSGAPYQEDSYEAEDEVAIVTDLGLIPLSEVSSSPGGQKDVQSEIDAVVDRIEEMQSAMNIEKLQSPWLPPLADRLYLPRETSPKENQVFLATIDEPEKQSQSPYWYTVVEDGNVGIFGSSGYGKTQTAITLLMGMARSLTPEEVHYYLLDFGNGGLLPLKQLPHTADYFLIDQERKIEKFVSILDEEMANRKRLFQQKEVSSIKMYNTVSEEKLPLLFVTIDNYDIVKDEMMDFEIQMNQLARDGQSLGVYMLLTATRVNSVRQSLMNNLKTKIAHYLMDQTETQTLVGRVDFEPEAIPGRAIVKKDTAFFSQIFLPSEGKDDYEQLNRLKEDVQFLREKYSGMTLPEPVPMLPTELTMVNFTQYTDQTQRQGLLPVGLNEETVKPVYVNFQKTKHCLVLGQAQKGKTNVLKVMANTILQQDTEHLAIFDSIDRGLIHMMKEDKVVYMENREHIDIWLTKAEEIFAAREEQYNQSITDGNSLPQFPPIYLMADGYGRFLQNVDTKLQDRIVKCMKNYSHLGFYIIMSGSNNELSKGYDALTTELKQIRQAIVLMKKSEQTLYTLSYDRKEPDIQPGFGYYVENSKEIKLQIPLMVTERKVLA
ncbi:type VII secretion protein EssC [Rossellomorea marisflavi]|uniref:Type VII secretion protein EssC n=1 Tax=Rossellomorea marisflavi TaxID=189381 RepID=A0A165KE42_9BACI|nr:type VII secretion protein EssC [Rossellomorea marisflavi]KMK95778.1 cell division protein FtsK [Rossellomorea marisflavi]KZE48952.1 type VII secretion protein EssC [Rossellomorea marisflavi]